MFSRSKYPITISIDCSLKRHIYCNPVLYSITKTCKASFCIIAKYFLHVCQNIQIIYVQTMMDPSNSMWDLKNKNKVTRDFFYPHLKELLMSKKIQLFISLRHNTNIINFIHFYFHLFSIKSKIIFVQFIEWVAKGSTQNSSGKLFKNRYKNFELDNIEQCMWIQIQNSE